MKTKKIIALLMASMLAVSAFSACASQTESSSSEDGSSSAGTSEDSGVEEDASVAFGGVDSNGQYWDGEVEVSAPGEVPIVLDEAVTLSIFAVPHSDSCSKLDSSENEFTAKLEEATNIKLEWTLVTSADKTAKLNLLFQSNSYEDLIFNSYWDGATTYSYAEQGFLLPISDYFDTQAYYYNIWKEAVISEGVTTEEALSTNIMPDGKIYYLSSLNDAFNAKYATRLWIYQPWLDTLGLEMPTTTEEFEEVLVAFKNEDPNGNGVADEIPLTGSTYGWNTDPTEHLMNSFVYYQKSDKMYLDDGEPTFVYTTEGYKDGVEWLSSLSEQGLLYQDTFTQDANALKSLTTQDVQLVGVTAGGIQSSFTTMVNGEDGDWVNWSTVAPLEGPDGVQYARYTSVYPTSKVNITSNCEYPVVAFKLLDYLMEEEVGMEAINGEEDVYWEYAEEGLVDLEGGQALYTLIQTANANDTGNTNYAWLQICHAYIFPGWHTLQSVVGDPAYDMESIIYQSAVTYEPYTPDVDMIVPSLIFEEDDATEMITLKMSLTETVDAFFTDAIVNGYSDEKWDAFQAELELEQVDRVEELYLKAYNEYLDRLA
ncbi:MAG: extracellular solute-binding protein [Clostridia bacterium]